MLDQDLPDSVRLLSIFSTLDSSQLVESFTRPSADNPGTGTLLDHIFTNRPDLVVQASVGANPVSSDHHGIYFKVKSSHSFVSRSILCEFMNYKRADFEHLNRLLELVPWSLYIDPEDIEVSWEGFLDFFEAASRDSVPRSRRRSRKFKPWISTDIKRLINKKLKSFLKAKKSNLLCDWNSFRLLRNQVKYESRASYWQYVNHLFSLPDNRKRFFAFVRERKRSLPPPVIVVDNCVVSNPADIASEFLCSFQKSFTEQSIVPHEPPKCDFPIKSLKSFDMSVTDVYQKLVTLQTKKAPGPDGLSSVLLKETALVSCHILQRIFNISLALGKVPTSWKSANITPVFKAGDKSCPSNYRPVALTSLASKIMESFVAKAIRSHCDSTCPITNVQHGFQNATRHPAQQAITAVQHRRKSMALDQVVRMWSSTESDLHRCIFSVGWCTLRGTPREHCWPPVLQPFC